MKKKNNIRFREKLSFDEKIEQHFNKYKIIWIIAAILVNFLIYSRGFNNQYLIYDDDKLILNNPYIVSFDSLPLSDYISIKFIANYDPITVLSHALVFKFFGSDPFVNHFVNYLMHLCNALFIYLILWKILQSRFIAWFVFAVFLVHPMHVESVAWVSERKDVLYVFFYLLAILSYLKYQQTNKGWYYYLLAILLMILGCGSKLAAITLPAMLVLLDLIQNKPKTFRYHLNKIPFAIISLIFIIFHFISEQGEADIISMNFYYSFIDRIFLATYSLLFYLIKAIFPVNLSILYPYPIKSGLWLPISYYLSAILLVIIVVFIIKKLFRNFSTFSKLILLLFAIVLMLLSPVLHIIPIGGWVIAADRYAYLAYPFYFATIAYAIKNYFFNHKNLKYSWIIISAIAVLMISFTVMSTFRIKKWQDTQSLFSDAIDKYHYNPLAYTVLGNDCFYNQLYQKAIDYYNKALSQDFKHAIVYYQKGLCYERLEKYYLSIVNYSLAIEANKNYADAYVNRGYAYSLINNYDKAIEDYSKGISINGYHELGLVNRGIAFASIGKYNESIEDLSFVINKNPSNAKYYFNRGMAYLLFKKIDLACQDMRQAKNLGLTSAEEYLTKHCKN